MITIRIGKRKYRGVYGWEDITLKQFTDLAAIEMPPRYEAFILAQSTVYGNEPADKALVDAAGDITPEDLTVHFPEYYRQIIALLTTIPTGLLEKASVDEVTRLYDTYFRQFVLTLIYHLPVESIAGSIAPYQIRDIRSFRVGLRRYFLPKTAFVMGQEVPLYKEPILTYAEAGDVFRDMKISKNDVDRLGLFTAIYCRPRGQKYKESKALKRAYRFRNIKMNIVWEVFFCTIRRLQDVTIAGQLFGELPRTIKESVSEAQAKSLASGA